MRNKTDQHTNVLIGTIKGCSVLANYSESGKLYSATLTWQGLRVSTDAEHYICLDSNPTADGIGDIPIATWHIVRDLVQCDVIEQLTELALAHQWFAG